MSIRISLTLKNSFRYENNYVIMNYYPIFTYAYHTWVIWIHSLYMGVPQDFWVKYNLKMLILLYQYLKFMTRRISHTFFIRIVEIHVVKKLCKLFHTIVNFSLLNPFLQFLKYTCMQGHPLHKDGHTPEKHTF